MQTMEHQELEKPISECPKAKPEMCMDCRGVVCADVEEDRVIISESTGETIIVYDNVKDCTLKTGEVDSLKHKLLKDVLWDLTTPLKGIKKHMAFVERVMNED